MTILRIVRLRLKIGEGEGRSSYDSNSLRVLIYSDHSVVRNAIEQSGVEDVALH